MFGIEVPRFFSCLFLYSLPRRMGLPVVYWETLAYGGYVSLSASKVRVADSLVQIPFRPTLLNTGRTRRSPNVLFLSTYTPSRSCLYISDSGTLCAVIPLSLLRLA